MREKSFERSNISKISQPYPIPSVILDKSKELKPIMKSKILTELLKK